VNRNLVGFVLIALFTISVIAIAASSLDSAPIESGFGIDENPATGSSVRDPGSGTGAGGGSGSGRGGSGLIEGTASSERRAGTDSGSIPFLVLIAVVSVLATGSIALIVWATGGNTTTSVTAESSPTDPSADAIDSGTHEPSVGQPANEVYRAWWEMVQQLDVPRSQSRSPAEFATAAIDAGMDPEMVAELTALFRSVRYGNAEITDDIERRALTTIAHIRSQTDPVDREDTDS
jgi:hypothetical protein